MSKTYKCPWCRFKFEEKDLKSNPAKPYVFNCPNTAKLPVTGMPVCQKILPPNYLKSEAITIALAGDKYSGKSNYQMALLYELQVNKALFKLGISGWPVADDETLTRITEKFNQIHEGNPLDTTLEVDGPFLIQLEVRNGSKLKTVYFSFYDNPGEAFKSPQDVIDNMENVLDADGVIFLIDPIEIDHLWETLVIQNPYLAKITPMGLRRAINSVTQALRQKSAKNTNPTTGGDPNKLRAYLEMLKRLGLEPKEIEIPVAFTVSKFNQLSHIVADFIPYDSIDMEIMCINSQTGKYDDRVQKEISKSVEQLLFPEDGSNLYLKDMIKQYYKESDFFACNSVKVNDQGKPIELEPRGVLLPLIWLLVKLNIYK